MTASDGLKRVIRANLSIITQWVRKLLIKSWFSERAFKGIRSINKEILPHLRYQILLVLQRRTSANQPRDFTRISLDGVIDSDHHINNEASHHHGCHHHITYSTRASQRIKRIGCWETTSLLRFAQEVCVAWSTNSKHLDRRVPA